MDAAGVIKRRTGNTKTGNATHSVVNGAPTNKTHAPKIRAFFNRLLHPSPNNKSINHSVRVLAVHKEQAIEKFITRAIGRKAEVENIFFHSEDFVLGHFVSRDIEGKRPDMVIFTTAHHHEVYGAIKEITAITKKDNSKTRVIVLSAHSRSSEEIQKLLKLDGGVLFIEKINRRIPYILQDEIKKIQRAKKT